MIIGKCLHLHLPRLIRHSWSQLDTKGIDRHDGNGQPHRMTAAMVRVEREHLWFALVGVLVVLFKVILDSTLWRRSFVPFLWPSCFAALGIQLVLHTE